MFKTEIKSLIDRGALFAVSHSGGKDSQAMLIEMLRVIPREQIAVFHATLGEFEWEGARELAERQARDAGVPFIVCQAVDKAGDDKNLFDLVERRFAQKPSVPSWPSKPYRVCTGELKTQPIEREIRRFMKARGLKLVVSCVGLRAAESAERAKKPVLERRTKPNDGLAAAGREAWDWLPIHELSTAAVFKIIRDAGQEALWVYKNGNQRASCKFCIFGSKRDLLNGALADPDLFKRYCELEERTGYTMHMSRKSLAQLVEEAKAGIDADRDYEAPGCMDLFKEAA